jgi:hypothetical protein
MDPQLPRFRIISEWRADPDESRARGIVRGPAEAAARDRGAHAGGAGRTRRSEPQRRQRSGAWQEATSLPAHRAFARRRPELPEDERAALAGVGAPAGRGYPGGSECGSRGRPSRAALLARRSRTGRAKAGRHPQTRGDAAAHFDGAGRCGQDAPGPQGGPERRRGFPGWRVLCRAGASSDPDSSHPPSRRPWG